jgi:tetratricopeptide (TPR) repeat protein
VIRVKQSRPSRIAACLIVRDAERTIEQALASIRPYVDEVDVFDTGSTDGTLDLLEALQAEPGAPMRVETGIWRDDFAWAREQSFAMASSAVDWFVWLDADDVVVGAEHLRRLAAEAPPDLSGFQMLYEYERDESGLPLVHTWRERLVRRDAGLRWEGSVHETLTGPSVRFMRVDAHRVRWTHMRVTADRWHPDRNLRLLRAEEQRCSRDGVDPPARSLFYLGAELSWIGEFAEAAQYFERYLARLPAGWTDAYLHGLHRLAACVRLSGDPARALELELEAARARPDSGETAAGVAESYVALGRWAEAETWAGRVFELGPPSSAVVERPLELTVVAPLRVAQAQARRGDAAAAAATVEGLVQRMPANRELERARDRICAAADSGDATGVEQALKEAVGRFDLDLRAFVRGLHLGSAAAQLRGAATPRGTVDAADALAADLGLERPLLRDVERARRSLRDAYDEYTTHVSSADFALSLETSSLVFALCASTRPARVLDLGSGFSSYVLRRYADESGGDVDVISVDDSRSWLGRTREFLEARRCSGGQLLMLDEFESIESQFDLVVHDLGDMLLRRRSLATAMAAVAPHGVLVLDDVDRPAYGEYAEHALRSAGFAVYDLAGVTSDAFGRYCCVSVAPARRSELDDATERRLMAR